MSRLAAFSRVVGMRAEHSCQIESLVQWYRQHDIKPTFEMVPGHYDPCLGRELARLGFDQSGFHASLIGQPDQIAPPIQTANIAPVQTADAMEDYLDAYVMGWGMAEKDHARIKANFRPWLQQPGWSLYLARVNGRCAAAAALFLKDHIGYLADATTVPSFRSQGLQAALLRRRILDAGTAGAQVVFSGTAPFSSSHRNMERVGMRVQFMRSLWTPK